MVGVALDLRRPVAFPALAERAPVLVVARRLLPLNTQ